MAVTASSVPTERDGERLLVVQALRLLAAMLVLASHAEIFAFHLGRFLGRPGLGRLHLLHGAFGVDLFFAISGFVIVLSSARLPRSGARRTFLRKRLVRVVPLYWFATLVTAGWLAHIGHAPTLHELLLSLLFVPYAAPPHGRIVPVLEPGWTLDCEMAFYLLFGLALAGDPRLAARRAVAMLAALVALGALVTLPLPASAWTRPIMLEFIGGMVVALAWRRRLRLTPWLRAAMAMAALTLLARFDPAGDATGPARVATAGAAGTLILAAAVLGPLALPGQRLWRLGGDISYALYLCHMPLMMMAQFVWRHFHWHYGPWHHVAFALGCIVASLGLAGVLHIGLEKPITARLNALLARKSTLRTGTTAA